MFKVGEAVVLNNSSQNKVMMIQAYNDEFIRAYWSKKEYSFAHESNFRYATEQEIAAGHRIDHFVDANNMVDANAGVTVITPKGTSKVKGGMTAFVDMGDDSHIENHVSPLCKMGGEVMRSDFESREAFERIFGGEGEIDLSKDETGEYSFQPSRFAYSFFLVAWQYRQTEVDELQKRVDAAKQLIEDLNKCYQQDHQNKFEYWRGFADSAGILRKRLEQALKGGS